MSFSLPKKKIVVWKNFADMDPKNVKYCIFGLEICLKIMRHNHWKVYTNSTLDLVSMCEVTLPCAALCSRHTKFVQNQDLQIILSLWGSHTYFYLHCEKKFYNTLASQYQLWDIHYQSLIFCYVVGKKSPTIYAQFRSPKSYFSDSVKYAAIYNCHDPLENAIFLYLPTCPSHTKPWMKCYSQSGFVATPFHLSHWQRQPRPIDTLQSFPKSHLQSLILLAKPFPLMQFYTIVGSHHMP